MFCDLEIGLCFAGSFEQAEISFLGFRFLSFLLGILACSYLVRGFSFPPTGTLFVFRELGFPWLHVPPSVGRTIDLPTGVATKLAIGVPRSSIHLLHLLVRG